MTGQGNINRGTIVNEFIDYLKLDPSKPFPVNASNSIVLTCDLNNVMEEDIVAYATNNNGTSQLLYTAPTDRDVWIDGIVYGINKTAASTATSFSVPFTLYSGAAGNLVLVPMTSGVALTQSLSVTFGKGIRLKRGTSVYLNLDVGANTQVWANMWGHSLI